MKFYYGYITDSWGFVDEEDPRHEQEGLVEITEEKYQELLNGQAEGKPIVYYEGELFNGDPDYYYLDENNQWQKYSVEEVEERKAKERAEHINNLTMTALDFIGVLQQFGLTLEQINAYLESNLAVKMQLTYCQNVYCGVVKALMPITVGDLTITADMVEIAFRIKNGEVIEESEGENG